MFVYILFSIITFINASILQNDDRKTYDNYKVIRIIPEDEETLHLLTKWELETPYGLNFWTEVVGINIPVDIMVAPEEYDVFTNLLTEKEIPYIVTISNVEPLIQDELTTSNRTIRSATLTFKEYYQLSQIYSFIDSLAAQFPSIVSVTSIGTSFENRELKLIKIGSKSESKKPAIWLDGAIHPREWISPAAVLYIVSQLVNNYGKDASITKLINTINFYVLPVINPDGYEYTWTKDRFWRKTRSSTGTNTWWCPWCNNCVGTDANRNFDFHWREQGTSTDPCQETYGGSSAFSEKETKAMSNYILSKKDEIKVYVSFHSYAQMWLVPYGHTLTRPENYQEMIRVAQQCVQTLTSAYGTRYKIGSPAELLYKVSGGSHDWAKGVAKIKYSYTLELRDTGTYGFVLPPSLIIPTSHETWLAFKLLATKLANNEL